MKRAIGLLAFLAVVATEAAAQAVPDNSAAARLSSGYRRPVQLRLDPFRHVLIPRWGLVISAGGLAANNALNGNDIRALQFIGDNGGLQPSHVLSALNLIPDGSGMELDGAGEGGVYLGGPIGGHFAIGLSGQARGYGVGLVGPDGVRLFREGNLASGNVVLDEARGAALVTAEAGVHALIRLGPIGSEDGVHMSLGFGGRKIWPQYYAQASVDPGSRTVLTPDSIVAQIGVTLVSSDSFALGTSGGSGFATDFLVRLEWPTAGLAFEAMVANLGSVTATGLTEERWSTSVSTTNLKDAIDSLDVADFVETATNVERKVRLPRVVRFVGSAWANRILQIDASLTLPARNQRVDASSPPVFDNGVIVGLGTTWRLINWFPLHAGVEINGRTGLGYTAGFGIEARNLLLRVHGASLGGWLSNGTGAAGRFELGFFF